jgi:hypothetical protein
VEPGKNDYQTGAKPGFVFIFSGIFHPSSAQHALVSYYIHEGFSLGNSPTRNNDAREPLKAGKTNPPNTVPHRFRMVEAERPQLAGLPEKLFIRRDPGNATDRR